MHLLRKTVYTFGLGNVFFIVEKLSNGVDTVVTVVTIDSGAAACRVRMHRLDDVLLNRVEYSIGFSRLVTSLVILIDDRINGISRGQQVIERNAASDMTLARQVHGQRSRPTKSGIACSTQEPAMFKLNNHVLVEWHMIWRNRSGNRRH